MASRYSIEAVFRAIDQFTSPLGKMTRSTKTFTQSLKTDFAKAQRQVGKWGTNIKRYAWIGVAALGAGIAYMAREGVKLASDLYEVQNVVDTTFEGSSKSIDDWSQTAITAFGLSELQAKQFTGTLGAAMKSSGITGDSLNSMSKDLVGLSGDFASFYNLPIEEAFGKIKSGMMGQSKPLKDLGINMSVANLEAFALTEGIKKQYKNMSESEKMILRYNYLMKVSKDAQGDFAKTLKDSLANQQRVLKTKFNQKMANMMQKLIPPLIKLTESFNNWLDTLDTDAIGSFVLSVFNGIKSAINIFVKFFKIIKPFAHIIFTIVAALAAYKAMMIATVIVTKIIKTATLAWNAIKFIWIAATQGMTVAQAIFNGVAMANPIFLVIIAIGILIGLIILIIKNWDKIVIAMKKAWAWIVNLAKSIWENLVNAFKAAIKWIADTGQKFTFILGPLGVFVSILIEIAKQWDVITEKFKSGDILGGILAIGGAILSGILAPIQGFLELVSKIPGVGNLAKGAAEKIQELRFGLTGKKEAEKALSQENISPISPSERSSVIREERNSSGELIIRDETGRAEMSKQDRKSNYKIKLQSSAGGAH